MQAVARRTRRTVAAAMLVAAVLGGAACSSSDDDAADLDLRARGTVPSSSEEGRRTSVADEPDLLDAVHQTVDARSVTADIRFEVTSDEGSMSQEISGTSDFEAVRGSVTIRGPLGMEARIDGATTWLRVEPDVLGTDLPGGAAWIEAPTDELVDRGLVNTDPDSTWAPLYLLAAATNVEAEGGGRYRFDLDLDALDDGSLTRREREAAGFALQYSDPDVFESVGGTVRLDDSGRVVELVLEVVGDEDVVGREGSFTISISLSDFDLPVTVQPPPADQVVSVDDHPELLDQLARMGQQLENA